jgi:hypothetical protein
MLRLEAGRNPHDKTLITLVGELSTQSELFRQHWTSHNGKFHRSGRKRLRHPAVGELDLNFEAMELPSEPGLRLNLYTADPGTPRPRQSQVYLRADQQVHGLVKSCRHGSQGPAGHQRSCPGVRNHPA